MFEKVRPAMVVSPNDRLDKVFKMLKKEIHTFVVVEKHKYKGIITDRALTSFQNEPDRKVSSITWKAPFIEPDMTLSEVSERFLHGYRELPVCKEGKVVGVMKHTDVLDFLLSEGRIPNIRVMEIMSKPAVTIQPDISVTQAAAVMRKNKMHHLIVTEDKIGRKLIGIVSMSDLLPFLERVKERPPHVRERSRITTIQLRSVDIPEAYTIRESEFLAKAAEKMIDKDMSTLVVFNGTPLGMIHVRDIIRASLPKVMVPLQITGLDVRDKEYRGDIRRECEKTLKKIEKIFPIEFATLNVKKHEKEGERRKYTMRFMVTGKRTIETHKINVNISHWDLFTALHEVLRGAERFVMEEKDRLKGKRRRMGNKRKQSLLIRQGKLPLGKPVKKR